MRGEKNKKKKKQKKKRRGRRRGEEDEEKEKEKEKEREEEEGKKEPSRRKKRKKRRACRACVVQARQGRAGNSGGAAQRRRGGTRHGIGHGKVGSGGKVLSLNSLSSLFLSFLFSSFSHWGAKGSGEWNAKKFCIRRLVTAIHVMPRASGNGRGVGRGTLTDDARLLRKSWCRAHKAGQQWPWEGLKQVISQRR